MFTSGTHNLTQIPWVDTNDMGVYWIGLLPLMDDEEWYDYVGSATGNGLKARRDRRYTSSQLNTEGQGIFFRARFHRRQKFFSHLRKTRGIRNANDIDVLAWATLLVIPGSADMSDPRDRTYFRWASMIGEAAFHLWLGSIFRSSATASQCSPWCTSGAAPRRKCSFPPVDLRFCQQGNTHSPLIEGLRGALTASISSELGRLEHNRRQREHRAANRYEFNRWQSERRAANRDEINRRKRERRAANRAEINRRRRESRKKKQQE